MFKKPFSFEGRIRRTEYGISYIIYLFVASALSFLNTDYGSESILLILYIPLIWFMLAQGAKRCHDRSASAWYQIIPFYVFWMLFANSIEGENEYGPNPKGIGNMDEINEIGQDLVS